MNYFKYLFALVLSVGIVSSAFAQDLGNCLSGFYSGEQERIRSYEIEVGYVPGEVIFLVEQDGERLCTSYYSPKFQINEDQIVLSSSSISSTGNINHTSGIFDDVIFTTNQEGTCTSFEAKVDHLWPFSSTLYPQREYGRTLRSFSEIKRICKSLPEQSWW